MANINFTISPAPGIINDMIAVIYDTNAPAAEITRQTISAPHDNPQNLSFPNVAPGTYIVKIHETPDGTTLGNLRHDFWVDASLEKLLSYTVKTFQVGLGRGTPYYDPADQDDEYINPDLDGLTYTVFKPGYGPLDWDANIAPHTGGGFDLTDGQKFSQDEIYTILVSNLVAQPINGGGGSAFIEGVAFIAGNVTFTSAHYRKMIIVNDGANLTINIANLSSIPDNMTFGINTHALTDNPDNPTLRYVTLQLNIGSCLVNTFARNPVYIGRAEEVIFIKKGFTMHVLSWVGDHRRLGETVFTDGVPPINSIPKTGGWYSKTALPRIFNWYVNRLPLAELGTGTDDVEPDSTNRKKWIIGIDKFWVPDHKDMTYKITDGSRLANSYQADQVGPASVRTTAWTGGGLGKNSLNNDSIGFLATHGDGGLISSDSASGTNLNSARTITFSTISADGETRIKNVAQNAYVII